MFKIQWKKTDTNLLFKSSHIIAAFLIVLTSFNVSWAVFDAPAAWDTFNLESYNVGNDPNGMARVAFDGQYVYFAPLQNNKKCHAEVVRYDTLGEFTDPASWKTFDYGKEINDVNIAGYSGVVFDGHYLYFSPWINVYNPDGSTYHGNVLRYDTQGDFESLTSWIHFNLEDHNSLSKGFSNIYFYDGYIYMPTLRPGISKIVRYNTTQTFDVWDSWEVLEVWTSNFSYVGMASDGHYIYFAPFVSNKLYFGIINRYDITKPFTYSNSWDGFHATNINPNLKGFVGALYAKGHVYFVTWSDSSYILRYDTVDFHDFNSWEVYPSGDAYFEMIYDNERYIYFTPRNDTDATGNVLRFDTDTDKDFNDPSNWEYFDPSKNGVGEHPQNYNGGVFDGQYIYFSPWNIPDIGFHSEILRYDSEYGYGTCWDPDECAGQPFGDATCDGDVNAGAVNLGDLLALKKAWGASGPPWIEPYCCADFNHDGKVNLGDLLILKENWGRTGFIPSTGNQICPE